MKFFKTLDKEGKSKVLYEIFQHTDDSLILEKLNEIEFLTVMELKIRE